MSRCPIQAMSTVTGGSRSVTTGTTWDVPIVELQKLLNLSERLSLDGEITPIEAWQRICRHAGFSRLTRSMLESLRAELAGQVACYGFGAVIDEVYFELQLEAVFANPPRAV
ncbi:hypothetical protein LTR70_010578 [Exophiala xenobiotica]|uniref:Uncharacterized protein n=1 Tax=Lithohypha guttulata TaxID=1690604 RepID=A0ABR0JUC2_9EURO|nr:hypothetical protein LTR24_010551 [Lithohypha guttulata]KAK5309132.1 hypothetical protein LTR70_010578 [Exophiala xenobiotica]